MPIPTTVRQPYTDGFALVDQWINRKTDKGEIKCPNILLDIGENYIINRKIARSGGQCRQAKIKGLV
jgi:hypothetical protein